MKLVRNDCSIGNAKTIIHHCELRKSMVWGPCPASVCSGLTLGSAFKVYFCWTPHMGSASNSG